MEVTKSLVEEDISKRLRDYRELVEKFFVLRDQGSYDDYFLQFVEMVMLFERFFTPGYEEIVEEELMYFFVEGLQKATKLYVYELGPTGLLNAMNMACYYEDVVKQERIKEEEDIEKQEEVAKEEARISLQELDSLLQHLEDGDEAECSKSEKPTWKATEDLEEMGLVVDYIQAEGSHLWSQLEMVDSRPLERKDVTEGFVKVMIGNGSSSDASEEPEGKDKKDDSSLALLLSNTIKKTRFQLHYDSSFFWLNLLEYIFLQELSMDKIKFQERLELLYSSWDDFKNQKLWKDTNILVVYTHPKCEGPISLLFLGWLFGYNFSNILLVVSCKYVHIICDEKSKDILQQIEKYVVLHRKVVVKGRGRVRLVDSLNGVLKKARHRNLPPDMNRDWIEQGLVRAIGVSNFSIQQIGELLQFAKMVPAVNQVELHPFWRHDELVKFCQKNGIHVSVHTPLIAYVSNDNHALVSCADDEFFDEERSDFDLEKNKKLSIIKSDDAMMIHGEVMKLGFDYDLSVSNGLMSSYYNSGRIGLARQVVDSCLCKDLVSWNSIKSGYADCGDLREAHKLFEEMPKRDAFPLAILIDGYGKIVGHIHGARELGNQRHRESERAMGGKILSTLMKTLKDPNISNSDSFPFDYWRGFFESIGTDIFELIDYVIHIVIEDCPSEFLACRDQIIDTCFSDQHNRIKEGSKSVEEVISIQDSLANRKEKSETFLFESLKKLQKMEFSVEILKDTKIKKMVTRLWKHPSKQILKGISESVCSGEILALMGPSGSGKTTLLKIISGRLNRDIKRSVTYNDTGPGELVAADQFLEDEVLYDDQVAGEFDITVV